jgi:VWFA-related protein
MKTVLAIGAAFVLLGQASPRFRSGVDVVRVDALVTDAGRAVTGLTAANFELRDNGIVQEIDSVTIDEVPVSMLLVLDTSNSVEGETLQRLKEAANAAIDALTDEDRAAILTFASAVTLHAGWTAPSPSLRGAIREVRAGGATSLYDALCAALTLRDDVPGRRPFVVLFSDGGDNSSWLPARAVLERARSSDAVVYVVTRRPPRRDARLEYRSGVTLWPPDRAAIPREPTVVELANLTGGHTFVAERADRLRDAFANVVLQVRSRYLIAYRPGGVESTGWHRIDLRLKDRSGTITARRGYVR